MTTTGGRGDIDQLARELEPLDGDDIEVVPGRPTSSPRGRLRAFLIGAVALTLVVAGIAVALVTRGGSGSSRLSSVAARESRRVTHPAAPKPSVPSPRAKHPVQPRVVAPKQPRTITPTSVAIATPVAPPAVTPTVPAAPPTPSYPPSVLTWQATPALLTIRAGGHASVAITVVNPTDGNVTLGQPLSCPPVLSPENGGPAIASGVCVQMAQVMSPLQALTQQYTIYATNTGDASGAPLGVGRYQARFENLHSISVTVTAS